MGETVLKCPQCGAPLAGASRFARSVVCAFCDATVRLDPAVVATARFREAFRDWNSPALHGYDRWFTISEAHFAPEQLIARGEIADVYRARRARFPTERVLLKVLRNSEDGPLFEREWQILTRLRDSPVAGAANLATRFPDPIVHGPLSVSGEARAGTTASVFRFAPGFIHTFEAVRAAHPRGIPPVAAIWVWRRILEMLSFIHRTGLVHAAVLPHHLLLQENEHGVRLAGFSCADEPGSRLRAVATRCERFYPRRLLDGQRLSPAADLIMSARCIAFILGGSGEPGSVPGSVPAQLAELIEGVAREDDRERQDPWTLREQLGPLSRALFGPAAFHPIPMGDMRSTG